MSTCSSSFDSNNITNTAHSLLNNVRDNKLKKVFHKCKFVNPFKQPKEVSF